MEKKEKIVKVKSVRKPRAKKKPVAAKPEVAEEKPVEVVVKPAAAKAVPAARYLFAIGRRKTALAKIKLTPDGKGEMTVNARPWQHYFPTLSMQKAVMQPFVALGLEKKFDAVVSCSGGGVAAQAEAVRLALSRALLKVNPDSRTVLKKQGFLRRDPRQKERKKPGLKRARRAPQWQKR
ncbi:30S ribosomal protein S9 [bacterium]|nr:MAG: 30S ribosomal protein S9 [bacterium]